MTSAPLRVLRRIQHPGGWTVVPIHYSHDPAKDPTWAAMQRAGYTNESDWNREMELDFSAVSGVRAYTTFNRQVHVRPAAEIVYNPMLPLCLCCDFNVGIMAWPVGQVVNGEPSVIGEIKMDPADVAGMVREFRNHYPAHPAEVWVYGDASGHARSVQSQQSNYDLMKLAFGGYASPVVYNVPAANPPIKTRLNSVNVRLRRPDGKPGAVISDACVELIADFEEVLLDDRGGDLQIRDPRNPYSRRTHASSALGYWWTRVWPVAAEARRAAGRAAMKDLEFDGDIPGDL